jgi:hypothetical protein
MHERKVNSLTAALAPPQGGAAMAVYLAAAVRALGGRSDADLARIIGVSPATVASWKSRGAVPEDRAAWFTANLVRSIAERRSDLPQVGTTARVAVIEALSRSDGNPLGLARFRSSGTAQMLGAMLALAEFFAETSGHPPQMFDLRRAEQVADLLVIASETFRDVLGPTFAATVPQ